MGGSCDVDIMCGGWVTYHGGGGGGSCDVPIIIMGVSSDVYFMGGSCDVDIMHVWWVSHMTVGVGHVTHLS